MKKDAAGWNEKKGARGGRDRTGRGRGEGQFIDHSRGACCTDGQPAAAAGHKLEARDGTGGGGGASARASA